MSLAAGRRLGPYEIVSHVGAGGMGEVWRAKDTRLDRDVAVKVLPASLAESEIFRARFEREAKVISQLSHPHVCTLFDVGQEGDVHFLVMEMLEGESLADRLKKGPLSLDQVLKVGQQVASALDAAHRQGVVHRDLKPGNVMLTKSGAKLLDFGLARTAGEGPAPIDGLSALPTEARPLTTEGTILGTFQYMAPEQLEGVEADARTDIFALGAVLYEMATGKRAFEGGSKTSLIAAIVSSQPAPISSVVAVAPPALDHVVRKCLEKDREDRWQSAHDVGSELQWISQAGSQAGVAAPVALRRKTRERLAWGVAALLATVALGLGVVLARRAEAPPRAFRATLEPPPDTQLLPFHNLGVALSPDGSQLAFAALRAAGQQLWLRERTAMESRPVAETEGASYPFWSPDGQHLGFFAGGKLKRVDLRGGSPQVLADAPSGRGASWSRDGVILFAPDITSAIYRVPAAGGEVVAVTRFDAEAETTQRWPVFLPDGQHFFYVSRSRDGGGKARGRLMLSALAAAEPEVLIEDASNAVYVEPGFILYGRDSSLYAWRFDAGTRRLDGQARPVIGEKLSYWEPKNFVVFTAAEDGSLVYLRAADTRSQVHLVDREGLRLEPFGTAGYTVTPRFSPDGKRVAFMRSESALGSTDVWIRDLEYGRDFRLTRESGAFAYPQWSPEGDRLILICQPKGAQDICLKSLKDDAPVALVHESESWSTTGSWLPSGDGFLVVEQDPVTNDDIYVRRLEGQQELEPLVRSPAYDQSAELSRDGRWLAYVSDEIGILEVYVRPMSGGAEVWQVSSGGASQPRWRADARELYYVAPDGSVMVVPMQLEPVFRPGEPRPLFGVAGRPDESFPLFEDVSPDGQRFLLNLPTQSRSQVGFDVVLNWPSLLDAAGN